MIMNSQVFEALVTERDLNFKRALLIDQLLGEYRVNPKENPDATKEPEATPLPSPVIKQKEKAAIIGEFKGTIVKPEKAERLAWGTAPKPVTWFDAPKDLKERAIFINDLFGVEIQSRAKDKRISWARAIYYRWSWKTTDHHASTIAGAINKSETSFGANMDRYDDLVTTTAAFRQMVETFAATVSKFNNKSAGMA